MDPISIAQMARIRQQELLNPRDDGSLTIQELVLQLGNKLVALGHKMRSHGQHPHDDGAK